MLSVTQANKKPIKWGFSFKGIQRCSHRIGMSIKYANSELCTGPQFCMLQTVEAWMGIPNQFAHPHKLDRELWNRCLCSMFVLHSPCIRFVHIKAYSNCEIEANMAFRSISFLALTLVDSNVYLEMYNHWNWMHVHESFASMPQAFGKRETNNLEFSHSRKHFFRQISYCVENSELERKSSFFHVSLY